MAVYTWIGYSDKGKETRGMIDADSPREAKLKLRAQGIFVSSISEELPSEEGFTLKGVSLKDIVVRVKTEDIAVMTRQLSTLVGASIPLVDALSALYEQIDHPLLKKVIAQIREAVNEGLSLADALSQHKRIFPDLYINMVRSGEASGALDVVLLRLAEFLEGWHRLRSKISAAFVYPILLFVVCITVLTYLLTAVVPKVVDMFETMNQVLPLPTRILIGVSDILGKTWYLIGIAIIVGIYLLMRWKATEKGALRYDKWRMSMPIFGSIYRKIGIARFARTLGTLLASGVPILEAMSIVKTVVQNRVMEAAITDAISEIMDGSSVAVPLKKSGVFPPIIIHMIAVGEKSGRLEDMLLKAADAYEDDVETTIAALTSVLEPVMILIMGVTVGFVVMAILFPMLEMSQIIR
ncbi:MAG: type II secretion system inner membrane protein GspF [Deltaproteobacteria bacterium]|nr:type II secretion system inner membrane protein GspF [Deltaproteobacteria bacterium]